MPSCSVFTCKNRSQTSNKVKDNVTFHLFPKDTMIRDVWIRACANHVSWTPKRTSTICSQHFEASCLILKANNKRELKKCAFPTLKLPKGKEATSTPEPSLVVCKILDPAEDLDEVQISPGSRQPSIEHNHSEKHYKRIEESQSYIKLKKHLQMKNKQIKRLQSQNRYLKSKLASLQALLNTTSVKKENGLDNIVEIPNETIVTESVIVDVKSEANSDSE